MSSRFKSAINRPFQSSVHLEYKRKLVDFAYETLSCPTPQRVFIDLCYESGHFSTVSGGKDDFRCRILEHINDMVNDGQLVRDRSNGKPKLSLPK